jgi:hypothetical protein
LAAFGLVVSSSAFGQEKANRGRKFKSPPPQARIEVTVLRDVNAKPIENAAVIFHLVSEQGTMELKTNEDGKCVIDVLPVNSVVRLQIIAKGFQTYGADYKLDKPELGVEVRMKRPGEQYSIYKPHDLAAKTDASGATVPPAAASQPK